MKNLTILLTFCSLSLTAQVQAQQITIKSSNAATHSLVIADKSIYSQNSTTVSASPSGFTTPIVGAGTRIMWLPTKSAFRVGTVTGANWNADSVGTWSFASGYDTKARGQYSTALGHFTIASGDNSTAMGESSRASGTESTAMGVATKAIGAFSTAIGYFTTAGGISSTAMGESTKTRADAATAMGFYTLASGPNSSSMGYFTVARGNSSTAAGVRTIAQAQGSFVVGRYNIVAGDSTNWINSDPLFVIGNGTFTTSSNALTVLKNGRTAIGFDDPQSMLHVKNGDSGINTFSANSNLNVESNVNNYISLLSPNSIESGLLFGNPTSVADGGVIYNNGNTKNLQFRTNGNVTRMTLSSSGNLIVSGSVTASCGLLICSDARYKKNITGLDNSLNNLLKISGVRYDLRQSEFPEKNFSDKNQIGFIAQDLEKIFPEMVFTDEKGFKSVDYARLTPVLVEAIKELNFRNQKLESRLEKIEEILSVSASKK
jgi:hypothetical protein